MTPFSREHAYGACHALTAALLGSCPSGEARGLFVDGECVHSAFRVPHTDILVDAFGAEFGPDAPSTKAARYTRQAETYEWRTLNEDDVRRMVVGDKARALRRARGLALRLLRDADEIEAGREPALPRPALPTPAASPSPLL